MIDTTPKRFIIAFLAMCLVSFLLGTLQSLFPETDIDYLAGFGGAWTFIMIAKKP